MRTGQNVVVLDGILFIIYLLTIAVGVAVAQEVKRVVL